MKSGVSAGRVQSPAIKILVDREKERTKFKQNEYWSLGGLFQTDDSDISAKLIKIGQDKVATGSSFDKKTGTLFNEDDIVLNEKIIDDFTAQLKKDKWKISKLEKKPFTQKPYAPFITSTLQQEGIRQFRMSAQNVMRTAQVLYENGYITYMRTDSVNLSKEAISASRKEVEKLYGKEYLPTSPIQYSSKIKNAQEAHEAIRLSLIHI